jgi:hypothetical protein
VRALSLTEGDAAVYKQNNTWTPYFGEAYCYHLQGGRYETVPWQNLEG